MASCGTAGAFHMRRGHGGRAKIKTLEYPSDQPRIVVALIGRAAPPVHYACHGDGCFAVVDGELYGNARLSAEHAVDQINDAATLLTRYMSAGQEVLAGIDGAVAIVIWDACNMQLLLY